MFHRCVTLSEAKNIFRRCAMKLHPDYGGDSDLMILLKECYDLFIEFQNSKNRPEDTDKSTILKYQKSFEDVFLNDERLEILNEIFEYSKEHPKYKVGFTLSIHEFLEEKGYITSSQYNCLVKNYYLFRMDKFFEEKLKKEG